MSANEHFFDERQPAAVQKHGILRRYVVIFATKTGSIAKGRTAIVDGNAGPGRYNDGSEGSPLLIQEAAGFVRDLAGHDVCLTFVEQKPAHARALERLVVRPGAESPVVINGDLEEHVDEALHRSHGRPLLTFLDPFGGSISFDSVTNRLMDQRRRMPTEVLLHFSLVSVRRKGTASLHELTNPKLAEQLDTFLGGKWWEPIMMDRDQSREGSATTAALAVSQRYRQQVEAACGCRSLAVEIRNALSHRPIYQMVLFTRNPHGLWHFADSAGGAYLDWLKHCSDTEYWDQRRVEEANGVQSLFGELPPPDRKQLDRRESQQHVDQIYSNVRELLEAGTVHLGWSTEQVYGEALGRARELHARAAVRQLISEGGAVEVSGSMRSMATLTLGRPD